MVKKYIVWFNEVDKHDVGLVGGKGANLGEMTQAKFPIPYGFIVTANAYFLFIQKNKLDKKIKQLLGTLDYNNSKQLEQVSKQIRKMIIESPMPQQIINKIVSYYENLLIKEEEYFHKDVNPLKKITHRIKTLYRPPLVAVRSSATAEDLPTASFAGQQETYLNVRGENRLLQKVKECWASLFTERAIFYRHNQGFDHFKVGLAAVIQRMVESDKSGIAFTIDPVSNDKTKIIIEAIYGLGEYIVGGKVTPDHYEVNKNTLIILNKQVSIQKVKLIKKGVNNKEVKIPKSIGAKQKLTDNEITHIALIVRDIEKHYYFPQDTEWAIEGNNVFIVQARPITTLNQKGDKDKRKLLKEKPVVTGSPASPGIGIGKVKIVPSPKDIDEVKKGDVLVAPQTDPDYVPAMKRASAIITDHGGRTSHAAIVSRELGIPAVVGTENATKKLKNGMVVTVNGRTGEVFRGSILAKEKNIPTKKTTAHKLKTKIYVNLAEPDQAEKVAKMNVDGVGLLRAEFMIANIGVHPKEFIRQHKEQEFINKLTRDLHKFASAFSPRPIVYRATDFKTNEYKHLKGGKKYEPQEDNPMLGFRGASRYIADEKVFGMELSAIKKIWERGFKNLHLMIPFVRVPWELMKIKDIVKRHGLFSFPEFKFLIMVEVPACALNLQQFIDIGIDGVSIGTNDLTMMLLGVDRDNENISSIYDERNPVVIKTLKEIVKTCARNGITSSICGQAASDYKEIVETLVNAGITSLSVNPDAVQRTRELVYEVEKLS